MPESLFLIMLQAWGKGCFCLWLLVYGPMNLNDAIILNQDIQE